MPRCACPSNAPLLNVIQEELFLQNLTRCGALYLAHQAEYNSRGCLDLSDGVVGLGAQECILEAGVALYAKAQDPQSHAEVHITRQGAQHCLPMHHAAAEPHIKGKAFPRAATSCHAR